MTEATDIVGRLLAYEGEPWETTACYNGTRKEAADEIEHLRQTLHELGATFRGLAAEVEKLQAALRPFADAYLEHDPEPRELGYSVDDLNVISITWADCKRAYEAINSGEGKP